VEPAATELRFEDAILLDQIRDHVVLKNSAVSTQLPSLITINSFGS
jgi:hypothetical protein